MPDRLKVLIVEDSVDDTFFVVRALQVGGFQVSFERVETQTAMQAALDGQSWDLVLSDYSIPQFSGAAALALFRRRSLDIPFLVVSGALGEDRAIELLKSGADDCVMKDNLKRLVPAVRRALSTARERRLRKQADNARTFLASIIQSCDEAIVGTALDGAIVSWNAAAERLYGYSAIEMIGVSISKLCSEAESQELRRLLERVGTGECIKNLKTRRRHKDGQAIAIDLTISPVRESTGKIIGASTIARERQDREERPRGQENTPEFSSNIA